MPATMKSWADVLEWASDGVVGAEPTISPLEEVSRSLRGELRARSCEGARCFNAAGSAVVCMPVQDSSSERIACKLLLASNAVLITIVEDDGVSDIERRVDWRPKPLPESRLLAPISHVIIGTKAHKSFAFDFDMKALEYGAYELAETDRMLREFGGWAPSWSLPEEVQPLPASSRLRRFMLSKSVAKTGWIHPDMASLGSLLGPGVHVSGQTKTLRNTLSDMLVSGCVPLSTPLSLRQLARSERIIVRSGLSPGHDPSRTHRRTSSRAAGERGMAESLSLSTDAPGHECLRHLLMLVVMDRAGKGELAGQERVFLAGSSPAKLLTVAGNPDPDAECDEAARGSHRPVPGAVAGATLSTRLYYVDELSDYLLSISGAIRSVHQRHSDPFKRTWPEPPKRFLKIRPTSRVGAGDDADSYEARLQQYFRKCGALLIKEVEPLQRLAKINGMEVQLMDALIEYVREGRHAHDRGVPQPNHLRLAGASDSDDDSDDELDEDFMRRIRSEMSPAVLRELAWTFSGSMSMRTFVEGHWRFVNSLMTTGMAQPLKGGAGCAPPRPADTRGAKMANWIISNVGAFQRLAQWRPQFEAALRKELLRRLAWGQ